MCSSTQVLSLEGWVEYPATVANAAVLGAVPRWADGLSWEYRWERVVCPPLPGCVTISTWHDAWFPLLLHHCTLFYQGWQSGYPSLLWYGSGGVCHLPLRLDFLTHTTTFTQPGDTKSSVKCLSLIWQVDETQMLDRWGYGRSGGVGGLGEWGGGAGRQYALPQSAPAKVSCAHAFRLPAWWEDHTL